MNRHRQSNPRRATRLPWGLPLLLIHAAACSVRTTDGRMPAPENGGGFESPSGLDSGLLDVSTDPIAEPRPSTDADGGPAAEGGEAGGASDRADTAPDRGPVDASRTVTDAPSDALSDRAARADAATAPSRDAGGFSDGATSSIDAAVFADDLQFCVDENNRYRAMVGAPALARSPSLEQFAAVGAQSDYQGGVAHQHFMSFPTGVPGTQRSAENEIPGFGGWNLRTQRTVHAVIAGGLALMWAEGPGGGHYDNMIQTGLHNVGCGIYVAPNAAQDVTVTIDFSN